MNKNWRVVTKQEPCLVCHKPDWCRVFDDGGIQCMRVESESPCKSGGWMHREPGPKPVGGYWNNHDHGRIVPVSKKEFMDRCRPPRTPPRIDAEAIWKAWYAATQLQQYVSLAESLGVEYGSLSTLGAAWAPEHDAWAFPMSDGSGKIVGIRLRNSEGRKWAVTGSKQGLFVPAISPMGKLAVIAEGPTDTAALLSIGMFAIGRPSCQGCMEEMRDTLKRLGLKRIIIAADNDEPKVRPDGSTWQPGADGAKQLQDFLKMPSLIITPPCKDAREWVRQGCTAEIIDGLASQRVWKYAR